MLDPSSLSQREVLRKKLSSRDLRTGGGLEFDPYNVEEALTGQQFRLACRWVCKVESSGTYERKGEADHGACLGYLNANEARFVLSLGRGWG